MLANETRLAIMLALWEAYDPHAEDNAVGFTELRGRVGIRQGAQFNCHLDQLVGVFVDSTDGGYRLRPVGLNLVQTLIAGTGQWGTFPWTEIDVPCHLCGAPTAVTVRDGWLYHVCTECDGGLSAGQLSDGTLFGEPFPPAAPANRTAEEIFAAGVFRLRQVTVMKLGGLCPRCSGVVESRLHICEDHDTSAGSRCRACGNASQVRIRWTCSVCKYWGGSAPSSALFAHPTVSAFYHEHGVDVGYGISDFRSARRALRLLRSHEQELVSTDSVRVLVTVEYEGERLRLTVDGDVEVVDVDRSPLEA